MIPCNTFARAVLLGAVLAGSAHAQRRVPRGSDSRSRVDTTFAFDRSGTVTVSASDGDIVVTGSSANQVHVRGESDNGGVRLDVSSNRAMIESAGASRHGGDGHFEVTVPYGTRVIARSQSGDVSVRGTRGEVEIHGMSGDVTVDEVNGRLDVQTLSGDIRAERIVGDVEITTTSGGLLLTDVRGNISANNTSGDIAMRGASSKIVRVNTTSGDITYDGTIDPAGRYDLTTHSGDLHLRVPRDASAQLSVSTWSGEINSDFPITLKPGEHGIGASSAKEFTFNIGGGAARISAKTFSGDVTVSSNGRGPARP